MGDGEHSEQREKLLCGSVLISFQYKGGIPNKLE